VPAPYRLEGDFASLPVATLATIAARGREVVEGRYEAYGHDWRALPRSATEWRTHPRTGYEFPPRPWWQIDLLPSAADVKDVWEPGRFTWAYDLVRAFAASRDPAYADVFHAQLAGWYEANPPFSGVQWACGQETAVRALAILHAADSLPVREGDGGAARLRVTEVLGCSGERIANGIGYGLSQRNNHGISEAAGLVHIGLRLRGVHPAAKRWLRLGCRLLDEQAGDQFYADGWYAQHSFTYMRVAMEQVLMAQHALTAHGMTLSVTVLDRARKSFELLVQLIDGRSGYVPNHGANDGSRTTPFSTAEYRDFRPLLTLAALVLDLPLPADIAPDPEVVVLFGGAPPRQAPARASGVWTGSSGWAAARIAETALFLRAGGYRHRPSHLDPLHLDVRFDGEEAILDPGTFAYNAPPPWNNGLSSAFVHNGPVVDEAEPGERGHRFLWYSWPSARLVDASYREGRVRLTAEIADVVRREIDATQDEVRVRDIVLKSGAKVVQVTWLLDPSRPMPHLVAENAELERIDAKEGDVAGWFSPSYGLRLRSEALRVRRVRAASTLQIDTTIRRPS
jgi:hypothetical protein